MVDGERKERLGYVCLLVFAVFELWLIGPFSPTQKKSRKCRPGRKTQGCDSTSRIAFSAKRKKLTANFNE